MIIMGILDNEKDGFKIYFIKGYIFEDLKEDAPEKLDKIAKNHLKELSGLLYITITNDEKYYKIYFYSPLNYYLYNTDELKEELKSLGIEDYEIDVFPYEYIPNDKRKNEIIRKIENDIKNYLKEEIIFKAKGNIDWIKTFH